MPAPADRRWPEVTTFVLFGLALWLLVTLVCRTNWSSRGGVPSLLYTWAYAHFVPLAAIAELLPRSLPRALRGGALSQAAFFALIGLGLCGASRRLDFVRQRPLLVRALLVWGGAEALFVVLLAASSALGLGAD